MTFGSSQLSVAVGATDTDDRIDASVTGPPLVQGSDTRERTMISASLLLGNGLNFTVASTEEELDSDRDDNEQSYVKLGWKTGKHAFSVSVAEGDGGVQATTTTLSNLESEGTAFAYNYQAASSLNLYAGFREVEVDSDANALAQGVGANVEDVDSLMLGAHLTWSSN
jgi:hypothetical protein